MVLGLAQIASAQCNPHFLRPLSPRPANYEIDVRLNDREKTLDAVQYIHFTNQSPVPVRELRLYMYFNAFKNTQSSFLKGTNRIFGQKFSDRKPGEWGWVDIEKFEIGELDNGKLIPAKGASMDLTAAMHYIQPDDANPDDQSVLAVPLTEPIQPGQTAVLRLKWRAQIPKTIARAGYSKDFFFICHWFPQLGVFEQNIDGKWGWNCHQFFRNTEFYADFGTYDVEITTANKFVVGASGCLLKETDNGDGTTTRQFHVEDVIDFAWTAYPYFEVCEDRWRDVQIRLLIPPEHAGLAPRYLHALKFALAYLDKHVGKYPYASITVVDPPFHGLQSGLMEYPTLITAGTFYGMPENLRNMESLVVHEFVHQYFMSMVASNEKEEPWLDEGFVTYFEDRIIDAAYGKKSALVDVLGYRFDNLELSRLEYTTLRNPRSGISARPGWTFIDANYKGLIYSKPATTLHALQRLVGDAKMDRIIQAYFDQWKFKHPRGRDFMAVLKTELGALPDSVFAQQVYNFFETSIYQAKVLDYAVINISNEILSAPQGIFGKKSDEFTYRDGNGPGKLRSTITVQRRGDWVFPVELLVTFEDGSTQTLHWSGEEGMHFFRIEGNSKVVSAQVDPQYKLLLDVDINNNSLNLQPKTAPLWKYAAKAVFWIQNLLQSFSFLV